MRGKLLERRSRRVRPGLDDKILADWNGLMIAALVDAGLALHQPEWLDLARAAFDFIAGSMTRATAADQPVSVTLSALGGWSGRAWHRTMPI